MKKKNRLPSPNTAYTIHSIHSDFSFTETSYMLGTLGDTAGLIFL